MMYKNELYGVTECDDEAIFILKSKWNHLFVTR
jgi:hypothetical protein